MRSIATILITGWNVKAQDPHLKAFDFHVQKPFADIDHLKVTVAQGIRLKDQRSNEGV